MEPCPGMNHVNACNASNFTPTDSRPDSMFDCARGLRSNYARFSRVRSAKELTFSTFTIPFRNLFPTNDRVQRDTNSHQRHLLPLYKSEIILLDRIQPSSFLPTFFLKWRTKKKKRRNYSVVEISSNVSSDNEAATLFERCWSQRRGN